MRLLYFKANNFGDELNPIIFNKLIPEAFADPNDNVDFLGIGSIIGLNKVLDAREGSRKIIFGSGASPSYMKNAGPFSLDENYEVFCVRGPMTAKLLGLDDSLAITDSAALLRGVIEPRVGQKKFKFSFMPHFESEDLYPWKSICEELGIKYVSPRAEPLDIIDIIQSSEVVLAEAMHYAIVADVLRTPWIPVKIYSHIDSFKWMDWCKSLDITTYQPVELDPVFQRRENYGQVLHHRFQSKYSIGLPGLLRSGVDALSNSYVRGIVKKNIKKLNEAMSLSPQLSRDEVLNHKTDLLFGKLDEFKARYLKS